MGGGKTFLGGLGQDPQKVISFDHFVQENAHFFYSTQSWGEEQTGWGEARQMPPSPTSGYVTGFRLCYTSDIMTIEFEIRQVSDLQYY